MSMTAGSIIIYDFSTQNSVERWQIVNDGVMGGLSKSTISLTETGHGKFQGYVSLANNGGFASVRLLTDIDVKPENKHVVIKLKGDGKNYQFRLKGSRNQRQSYVQDFETNGDWQTIKLNINEFYPQYRGRKLDLPNFDFSKIEEVRFLIANKKEQNFELLIDSIELE
jgi:hypothetical protein